MLHPVFIHNTFFTSINFIGGKLYKGLTSLEALFINGGWKRKEENIEINDLKDNDE